MNRQITASMIFAKTAGFARQHVHPTPYFRRKKWCVGRPSGMWILTNVYRFLMNIRAAQYASPNALGADRELE